MAPIKAKNHIIIDKPSLRLSVVSERGDTIGSWPVSVGTNAGHKQRKGDLRTPEGHFSVVRIEESSHWDRHYVSGQGYVSSYGPWFIRLSTPPFGGIGIHGTSRPSTIGTRESEGCIRMLNNDLCNLVKIVEPGMEVIVTPDTTTWPEKVRKYTGGSKYRKWSGKKSRYRKYGRHHRRTRRR